MMNQKQVVSAFWQGMPQVWRQYRRRTHNAMPADIRVEFSAFVDMLHRDGHISDAVARAVTLDDSGRKAKS